jgi:hypothetical protein
MSHIPYGRNSTGPYFSTEAKMGDERERVELLLTE